MKSETSKQASPSNTFQEESRRKRRCRSTQLQLPHRRHWTDTARNKEGRERRQQCIELGVKFIGRSTRNDALRLQREDKCHVEFLCELTSEVNSMMKCVTKARICQCKRTNDHERATSWSAHAKKVHRTYRHFCAGTNDTSEKVEQAGTWVYSLPSSGGISGERTSRELKTREQKKKAKDAKKTRGIIRENKGTICVQDEMQKLMHHGEQELLSLWEGRHWDDNKAGGLTLSCAPRRDVRRWRTFVATRCTPESPERRACGRRRRRPSRPG